MEGALDLESSGPGLGPTSTLAELPSSSLPSQGSGVLRRDMGVSAVLAHIATGKAWKGPVPHDVPHTHVRSGPSVPLLSAGFS